MTNDKPDAGSASDTDPRGIKLSAGDRPYFPAGALQIWINPDGTTGGGASLAVDPWLPDLSLSAGTPRSIVEGISKDGFPVSTICNSEWINGAQRSREVRELIARPEAPRLKYLAVLDGTNVCGVLDLDRARGAVRFNDLAQNLKVEDLYEPLNSENCLQGDAPLMDYLLTADKQPFRLIELPNHKVGTVDIEDLQKLPVRALLFMQFSYLETLLARQLCATDSRLLEIVGTARGIASGALGDSGSGPERRIERYRYGMLLRAAKRMSIVSLSGEEISFLEKYRNNLAHGPRWYITSLNFHAEEFA